MNEKRMEAKRLRILFFLSHLQPLLVNSVILIINLRLIHDVNPNASGGASDDAVSSFPRCTTFTQETRRARQENFRPREGKTISSLLKDPLSSGPSKHQAAPFNDAHAGYGGREGKGDGSGENPHSARPRDPKFPATRKWVVKPHDSASDFKLPPPVPGA